MLISMHFQKLSVFTEDLTLQLSVMTIGDKYIQFITRLLVKLLELMVFVEVEQVFNRKTLGVTH